MRLFEQRDWDTSTLENPSVDLVTALTGLTDGVLDSASGASVTPIRAMRQAAFFRCVAILGSTIGASELLLYARDGRARTLEDADPRFSLIHDAPNGEMTAYTMWQYIVVSMAIYGNGFLWMETDPNGNIVALWPIHPGAISRAKAPDGSKIWVVEASPGESSVLYNEEVMHFQGIGLDTDKALAPYQVLRDELGISMAATDYAARTFQNASVPGGVYTTEKEMTEQQFNLFMSRQKSAHEGMKNSHRMAVLPKGMTYTESSWDASNTQMIDARVNQAKMVAMVLGIPPRMLGINDGTSSYASVEQDNISFITHTLRPWLVNIQQVVNRGMFSGSMDKANKLFVEFDTTPLMVPDSISRSKIDQSDRMFGIKTANELREARGLPPAEGGDLLWMPINLTPIDATGLPMYGRTGPVSDVADPGDPLGDPSLYDPASSDSI